jgi:hypothetical protein
MTSSASRSDPDGTGASRRLAGLTMVVLIPIAVVSAACQGEPSSTPTPGSPAASSAAASTPAPSSDTATTDATPSINARAPLTQRVRAGFDPPFTLRIPAPWTSVLRDVSAFQVYAGNEDYEITFDHTYRARESVAHAIARLVRTDGLQPGPVKDVAIGGRQGKGFKASSQSAVVFTDSGFHTNQASRLEVFAIPVEGGGTVTVFLTAEGDPMHGLDALAPLARRIFKTVDWR